MNDDIQHCLSTDCEEKFTFRRCLELEYERCKFNLDYYEYHLRTNCEEQTTLCKKDCDTILSDIKNARVCLDTIILLQIVWDNWKYIDPFTYYEDKCTYVKEKQDCGLPQVCTNEHPDHWCNNYSCYGCCADEVLEDKWCKEFDFGVVIKKMIDTNSSGLTDYYSEEPIREEWESLEKMPQSSREEYDKYNTKNNCIDNQIALNMRRRVLQRILKKFNHWNGPSKYQANIYVDSITW